MRTTRIVTKYLNMNYKRIVTPIITLLMLIALLLISACDSGVIRFEDTEEAAATPATPVETEETEVAEVTEVTEVEEVEESEKNNKSEEPAPQSGDTIRRGVWKNGIYTNESAGLQFLLPDGWFIATDQEIADMMGVGLDVLISDSDTDLSALMDSLNINTIYDMLVSDVTGASIMIAFEKLAFPLNRISEDQYIDAAGNALKEMGMDATVTNNNESVKIGDNMWRSFNIAMNFGDVTVTMRNFVVIHNDYAFLLQFSYNDASKSVDDLLMQFFGMNDPVPGK